MTIGGEQSVQRRESDYMEFRPDEQQRGEKCLLLVLSEGGMSVESGGMAWVLEDGNARERERERIDGYGSC